MTIKHDQEQENIGKEQSEKVSNVRTCASVIESFNKAVKDRQVIPGSNWIDAALVLNVMIGDEHDILFDLEQQCSKFKAALVSEGNSVAHAKSMLEAEDMYRAAKKQKAFIGQIEEFIRLSKKQATLKDNEWQNH